MNVNAMTEKYDEMELFGVKTLFTNNRVDRNTIPAGWYAYDIRDDGEGKFCTLEKSVCVNHAGTVLSPVEFSLGNDGCKLINDSQNFTGDAATITDYRRRYMQFPNRETVEQVRKEYPKGTRVRLIKMDDKYAPPIGSLGTVEGVDDTGSLMMKWDEGGSLNVLFNIDIVEKVTEGN